MRLVVADTSPLNYLVLIGQVEILPALFEKVFVPQIVRNELRHDEAPERVRRWIGEPPSWLEIAAEEHVGDDPDLRHLDDGERAAILLAVRIGAELLLIDDRDGVIAARSRGLSRRSRTARAKWCACGGGCGPCASPSTFLCSRRRRSRAGASSRALPSTGRCAKARSCMAEESVGQRLSLNLGNEARALPAAGIELIFLGR
jgi:predicted nucleic acid-binding protein